MTTEEAIAYDNELMKGFVERRGSVATFCGLVNNCNDEQLADLMKYLIQFMVALEGSQQEAEQAQPKKSSIILPS
jgi:hypothetical protein